MAYAAKHEALQSKRLFYCFVDFGTDVSNAAKTYVVPAPVVATALRESHEAWLDQPGKKGQQRNDNTFRRFLPDYSHLGLADYGNGWLAKYGDGWKQLRGG